MTPAPPPRTARGVFVLYALALVTATHWPGLAIASPSGLRLDLLIHAGAFGTWLLLLCLCRFFGPILSPRNLVRCALLSGAYALLDELTQGIPILRRTIDPWDLGANLSGIALAAGALGLVARAARKSVGSTLTSPGTGPKPSESA